MRATIDQVDMDDKATVPDDEAMLAYALLLLVLAGTAVALARTVRADGLGHRPPPRSHADGVGGAR
ncbi:hypothetical protein [Cellulomonas flavigena]|uniref:hypothetical protein n=1 Tax=Cellulomonas flavigena TaxID=1711 RepID=UPI00019E3A0B|nr:hypothetical protein [Cellulomonas flavigena]